jgi:hypothetical protein
MSIHGSILQPASIMNQDSEHPINNADQILRELLLACGILEHGLARHVLDEKTKKHLMSLMTVKQPDNQCKLS